jgi:2-polyprenyl-3-methyl-5-hydroxy-6-metoxy-1,4-benzoquinol methylase
LDAVAGEAVRRYFDGEADRFDAIYRDEKSLSQKLIDSLFRSVIHERYEMALGWCGDLTGKRVLDVGTGSGRYAVEMARRGAQVVGLDFAPAMVEMAQSAAAEAGVADRCHFEAVDFLTWCAPHHFDICLGIGFFDYTADPHQFLARMAEMTQERGIFSFPMRWRLRTPTRWLRLRLRGCPVYFYDEGQVKTVVDASGWGGTRIERLSRDYLVNVQSGCAAQNG